MKIGGKHLLAEYKPIGNVAAPYGELAVFNISHGDMDKVTSHHGLSVKGVAPKDLVHRLLPFILHKSNQLKDDGSKPNAPTLTEVEIRGLADDVIESALAPFIAAQFHLYKGLTSKVEHDEKGKPITVVSHDQVKHPKQENETNVEYLHRLLVLDEEKTNRQMAQLFGAADFSAGLRASIQNTLGMGDSISKAMDAIRLPKMPNFAKSFPVMKIPDLGGGFREPPTVMPLKVDFAAISKSAEEARWAPFDAVNERLDDLVVLSKQSMQFMVQTNETQTQIAAEIKGSSEGANRIGTDSLKIAKWGLRVTVLVFLLTVLGLAITMASWWTSGDTTQQADKRSEQIVQGLSDVKAAVADNGQSSARDITAMLTELKAARADQVSTFEAKLNEQMRLLRHQTEQSATDRETIDDLKHRILELEDQLRRSQPTTAPN